VRYLAELRGPFGRESFVPTGGITTADLGDWLRAGAFAVALGSELAGRTAPAGSDEIEAMANRTRTALDLARTADSSGTADRSGAADGAGAGA